MGYFVNRTDRGIKEQLLTIENILAAVKITVSITRRGWDEKLPENIHEITFSPEVHRRVNRGSYSRV